LTAVQARIRIGSMREKLTLLWTLLAAVVCAAGCGGSTNTASPDETSSAIVTESAPAATATTSLPIQCLDAAGYPT
jgi:hypothetical protein